MYTFNFLTIKKMFGIMKKNILNHATPEVSVLEVVAERGYENSTSFDIPDLRTDTDDWA